MSPRLHVSPDDQRILAAWAADCAERALPRFEAAVPGDPRPRAALEACRAWVRGEVSDEQAREAGSEAQESARATDDGAAKAAARAAGHAAATARKPRHAATAARYAVAAVVANATDEPENVPSDGSTPVVPEGENPALLTPNETPATDAATNERDWQYDHLAEHLRAVVFTDSGLESHAR